MICPICQSEVGGNQFCPNCGGNMSAFEGVSQDKVIINQTPAQQMAAGDDSVTQLIPENYMNATGDDSVTQLIPENYMSAQGDDETTILLDPRQVQKYTSSQQPVFNQQPTFNQQAFNQQPTFNQAPYMGQEISSNGFQQGYGQPQMGYQQPVFNQGGFQQNSNQMSGFDRTVKVVPPLSKGIGVASMVLTIALLITCLIFVTKPIFYVFQSHFGGALSDAQIEDVVLEQDPDGYEEANQAYQIFALIITVFVLIAALNAWSCFNRLNKNCVKSPVNKAVGTFVLGLIGVVLFVILKIITDEAATSSVDYDLIADEGIRRFNIYNLAFVLGIASVIVNLANIFTSVSAKKATR